MTPLIGDRSATTLTGHADKRTLLVAALIFSALSLAAGLPSDAFLEADACTHYLYSRFLFQEPYRIVDVWGRPVCTAIYAIPAALFGRVGTKVCSLLIALAVAWTAYRVARAQGYRWPAVAFIGVLAQPLVFLHSFTEMTELPFALLLGLAFLAYCRGRWGWCALLVGLLPLARPEGFGFILLAGAGLLLHRRYAALPLLLVGLAGWNHLGWEMFGHEQAWWRWLPAHWPYDAGSLYDRGHPLKFLATLPGVVGPLLFPATVGGMWGVVREGARALTNARMEDRGLRMDKSAPHEPPSSILDPRPPSSVHPLSSILHPRITSSPPEHDASCRLLTVAIPAAILLGHSVLHATGKMASNGELRYMLIVAPFWGLLTARGVEWFVERLAIRRPHLLVGALALAAVGVNVHYKVVPVPLQRDERIARDVSAWAKAWPGLADHPTVIATHPVVYYYLDRSPTSWSRDDIRRPKPGVLLILNDMYAAYNADSTRSITDADLRAAGWTPVTEADPHLDIRDEPQPAEKGPDWQFRAKWTNWRVYRSPDARVEPPMNADEGG